MPKISVVVPVYKTEAFLDECVRSLVTQTLTDLEIILVDDGSPDHCPQMCDEWAKRDNRIRVIHQSNGGPQQAILAGVTTASAAVIGFVDSDDYVRPAMFEAMWNAMQAEQADCVRCGVTVQTGMESYTTVAPKQQSVWSHDEMERLVLTPFWEQSGDLYINWSNGRWDKIYRKAILLHALENCNTSVCIGEDALVNLWVLPQCNRVVTLPECYYCCRYNEDSMTHGFPENLLEKNQLYLEELKRTAEQQHRQGKALPLIRSRTYAVVSFQALVSRESFARQYSMVKRAAMRVEDGSVWKREFLHLNPIVRFAVRLVGKGYFVAGILLLNSTMRPYRRIRKIIKGEHLVTT